MCQQALSVLRSPDAQAEVRKHFESQPSVRLLLPWTPREARLFIAVAVTAGICEEILYRGYLLWYLRQFMPGGVAIVTAVLAFGVGHVYQGAGGVFATGVAGAVAMTVFLLTDSLLAPMMLHAALDLVNGLTISRVCPRSVVTEAEQPS
jgi:membrane protease YdiL (CAAX protease family)